MKLVQSRVLLIVPHRQFSDEEYLSTRQALEQEGCRVQIAAASIQPAVGMQGTQIRPEMLFSDVRVSDFDGVVFIGGKGARDFWQHPRAHNLVREFDAYGKLLAAICLAPVIIARTGILKDRKGTCHPSAKRDFVETGAQYLADAVIVDGKIVTASGPEALPAFNEKIISFLSGSE